MKKILSWTLLSLVAFVTFSACDDNDDDDSVKNLPLTVQSTFGQMFPSVEPEWDFEDGFYKADFYDAKGNEVDVYFSRDGAWVKTETDLSRNIPSVVSDYVDRNYAGYRIDDVDLIQMPDEPDDVEYYLVELEKNGVQDVHLKLNLNGELIP